MAVLQSWYVMVFIFITQFLCRSHGDETEQFEKSINKLLHLQNLVTGYDDKQEMQYNYNFLNEWTLNELQEKIKHLYDQLECGYLFGARLHMKLTKQAVLENVGVGASPETVKAISFEVEALMMIDSLLDAKHGRINELWLLFIQARRMRVFIGHKTKGGGVLSTDTLSENQWINDYVLWEIEKRIADGCAQENCFNVRYEECKHWPFADGQPTEKGFLPSPMAQPPIEKFDDQINAIRANKELLWKIFRENQDKGLLRLSHFESLSDGFLLLFPSGQAFQVFVEKFLAGDSDRVHVQFPGFGFEGNLSAVKALGEYQQRVIGTLEIIMLQIILSYTNRLSESGNILQAAKKFNYQVLDPYQHLMEYDTEFDDIYDGFLQCHDDIEACQKFLNIEIVEQIKTITNKSNLPEIKSTVTGSDMSLDGVRRVGVTFVETLKDEIGENRIRLVQSFLIMIEENSAFFEPFSYVI